MRRRGNFGAWRVERFFYENGFASIASSEATIALGRGEGTLRVRVFVDEYSGKKNEQTIVWLNDRRISLRHELAEFCES